MELRRSFIQIDDVLINLDNVTHLETGTYTGNMPERAKGPYVSIYVVGRGEPINFYGSLNDLGGKVDLWP